MRLKAITVHIVLLILTSVATAGNLSLGSAVDLPGAGIRIRPFKKAKQIPRPSPRAWVYQMSRTREKIETYAPIDLWFRDQHAATFHGDGAQIIIAQVSSLIPANLTLIGGRHVRESEYTKARDALKVKWGATSEKLWVEAFAGGIKERHDKIKGLSLRFDYSRYTFKQLPPQELQGILLHRRGKDSLFIVFRFAGRTTLLQADKAVVSVLKSIATIRGRPKNDTASRKFQDSGSKVRGKRSAKFLAAKNRVVASIENLGNWWYVETPNYIIKSNMTSKNRKLVQTIQKDIEIMRTAYASFVEETKEVDEIGVVTVFNTRKDYLAYVPKDRQWTSGLWMASRKELVVSPPETKDRRLTTERVLRTAYHEAFHQYLFYAIDYVTPPTWLNEGHAMLFEGSQIDRSRKRIRVVEDKIRAKALEEIIRKGRFDLSQLTQKSSKEFYREGDVKQNYALAWGLVYFLRKGGHLYKNRKYDQVCDTVLSALKKTGDWKKATKAGMALVDKTQLHTDFLDFWKSSSKRRLAAKHSLFDRRKGK